MNVAISDDDKNVNAFFIALDKISTRWAEEEVVAWVREVYDAKPPIKTDKVRLNQSQSCKFDNKLQE